jgi:MFS family permease
VQIPLRLQLLLRTQVPTGVLLAAAYGGIVLSAAPFLIPAIATEYRIGLGVTALVTTGQLAGFVAGSWGAGRFLEPRRRVFVGALVTVLVTNALSAALPAYGLLVALRVCSGLGLGIVVWFGWVLVFGDSQRTAEVAVVGPVVGVFSAPVLALCVDRLGPAGMFGLLSLLALVPLAFNRTTALQVRTPRRRERTRPVPAAAAILLALGTFTMGGAAVFSFSAFLATERIGLSPLTISAAYSLNALAGIIPAKWGIRGTSPALWLAGTTVSAIAVATVVNSVVFFLALVFWGFSYWAAVPPTYTLLAERSRYPQQRAGDAQAVMAAGRVLGPLAAGVLLDNAAPWVLALLAAVLMGSAALTVAVVRRSPSTT